MNRLYEFFRNTVVLKASDDIRISLRFLKAFDILKCAGISKVKTDFDVKESNLGACFTDLFSQFATLLNYWTVQS